MSTRCGSRLLMGKESWRPRNGIEDASTLSSSLRKKLASTSLSARSMRHRWSRHSWLSRAGDQEASSEVTTAPSCHAGDHAPADGGDYFQGLKEIPSNLIPGGLFLGK